VAVCLFITSIALVLIAHAAPQVNLLSGSFALRLLVGLGMGVVFLPEIGRLMEGLFGRVGSWLRLLV
jgi:flagellar biosynthesis protein FliR